MSKLKYNKSLNKDIQRSLGSAISNIKVAVQNIESFKESLPTRYAVNDQITNLTKKESTEGEEFTDANSKHYYEINFKTPYLNSLTNLSIMSSGLDSINTVVDEVESSLRAVDETVNLFETDTETEIVDTDPLGPKEVPIAATGVTPFGEGSTEGEGNPTTPGDIKPGEDGKGNTSEDKEEQDIKPIEDPKEDGKGHNDEDTNPYDDLDVNVDTNGDGKPDLNIDTNGDGIPDINIDTDKDGKPNVNIDTNGDGVPDVNIDTDGDGRPNVNIDTDGDGIPEVDIDTDGDGKPNTNIDKDGDGKPEVNIDLDQDGKPDINVDTDGDGKPDLNIVTGDGDLIDQLLKDGKFEVDENGNIKVTDAYGKTYYPFMDHLTFDEFVEENKFHMATDPFIGTLNGPDAGEKVAGMNIANNAETLKGAAVLGGALAMGAAGTDAAVTSARKKKQKEAQNPEEKEKETKKDKKYSIISSVILTVLVIVNILFSIIKGNNDITIILTGIAVVISALVNANSLKTFKIYAICLILLNLFATFIISKLGLSSNLGYIVSFIGCIVTFIYYYNKHIFE